MKLPDLMNLKKFFEPPMVYRYMNKVKVRNNKRTGKLASVDQLNVRRLAPNLFVEFFAWVFAMYGFILSVAFLCYWIFNVLFAIH